MVATPAFSAALLLGLLAPVLAAPVDVEVSSAQPLAKRDCDQSTAQRMINSGSILVGSVTHVGQLTVTTGDKYCYFKDEYTGVSWYGPTFRIENQGSCEATLSIARGKQFTQTQGRRSTVFYDGTQAFGCYPWSQDYKTYADNYQSGNVQIWFRSQPIGGEFASLASTSSEHAASDRLLVAENITGLKAMKVKICNGKPGKKPCV